MIKTAREYIKLRNSQKPEEYNRANDEEIADEASLEIIRKYPKMKKWLAMSQGISDKVIELLAIDSNPDARWGAAKQLKSNYALFAKLAADPKEDIRRRLVYNPHTPLDILEQLTHDPWDECGEEATKKLIQRRAAEGLPQIH